MGAVLGLVFLGGLVALYFAPTIAATQRHVPNVGSVAVINFLLGWTLIGWAVAFAMAMRDPHPSAAAGVQPAMRTCPHCAERIMWAARVCRHCGRDVEIATGVPEGHCSSCGAAPVRPPTKNCVSCGALMVTNNGPRAVPVSPGYAPTTRPCPLCAEMISPRASVCPHCGGDIEPALLPLRPGHCPKCGAAPAHPPTARCMNCGAGMAAGT